MYVNLILSLFYPFVFTSHLPQQANTVNVTTPDVSKHLAQNTETVDGTAIQKVHTKEVKPYDKVADPLPNKLLPRRQPAR